jgi:hypothetical protein
MEFPFAARGAFPANGVRATLQIGSATVAVNGRPMGAPVRLFKRLRHRKT